MTMETIEALQWLKSRNLYETCKNISNNLKKVFTNCLAVKDEKILIIGDKGSEGMELSPLLSGAYYLAAESMKLNTKLVLQEPKTRGSIADEEVINSLASLQEGNIVFLNMSDTLGSIRDLGKSFRKLAKKKQFRFVSTPSLGNVQTSKVNEIISAIDVDYKLMKANHDKVRKTLDDAKEIQIKTKAGTDIIFNVDRIKSEAADGNYTTPGIGGNIPAGEVYIAPNGKNVNGNFVVDGSSKNRHKTSLIKQPITLKIEKGSIVNLEGGKEAKLLQETLDWAASISKHPSSVRRIGELGIGLNKNAKIIGITIVDEKAFSTAHIAIGSNYWFGGSIYSKIHLDQICKNPEIFIDGSKLQL